MCSAASVLTKIEAPVQSLYVFVFVCVCVLIITVFFLFSQLVFEVEEKEAIVKKMNKQSKSLNKIKRGESSLHST